MKFGQSPSITRDRFLIIDREKPPIMLRKTLSALFQYVKTIHTHINRKQVINDKYARE